MAWIEPFVSWLASHIPTKDDFNRIEGNILHLYVNKVTKVEGKNLSTNDYTTTEKDKLAGIESGARKSMPASEILTELKTVDGAGSGLDADTLDGNNSSAFAPSSHASTGTSYGLGTTANYGHVKTINGLTQSSHVNGTALSAYQGKVLKDLLDTKITPNFVKYQGLASPNATVTIATFDITKHTKIFLDATKNAYYSIASNNLIFGISDRSSAGQQNLVSHVLSSTPIDVTYRLESDVTHYGFTLSVSGNTATLKLICNSAANKEYSVILY